LAYHSQLISSDVNQIMILTVVLSMILTPFILNNIKFLANIFFKEPTELRERAIQSTGYDSHIIICGYGPMGQRLAKIFKAKKFLYVILEHDIRLVDKAIADGERAIFLANAAQKGVLEHFCIKNAMAIVVTITNEHQLRLICENIDSFKSNINTIVNVRNSSQAETIADLNINNVVISQDIVSDIVVERALECELILGG